MVWSVKGEKYLLSFCLLALVFGCSSRDRAKLAMIDPNVAMSREAFRENMLHKGVLEDQKKKKEAIQEEQHEFLPIIASPGGSSIGAKLISLSITSDVDVKEVIRALANQAGIDIVLDDKITAQVNLNVTNRSLEEVIDLIAEAASLQYKIKNGVLYVREDTVHMIHYHLPFLNMSRSGSSKVTITTDLSTESSGDESGGGKFKSGSQNDITMEYKGDLWDSIEQNIDAILKGDLGDFSRSSVNENVEHLIKPFYTANRTAGVISIMGDKRQHAAIKKYIAHLKKQMSAQVLIEAKLIEVTLDDEYRTGIRWNKLFKDKSPVGSADVYYGAQSLIPGFTNLSGAGVFKLISGNLRTIVSTEATQGSETASDPTTSTEEEKTTQKFENDASVEFLEKFGVTRTLQNPRTIALNNQQSVLTFVTNHRYFTVQGERGNVSNTGSSSSTTNTTSVNSTLHTVPIGVILVFQPSIDLEKNEIMINLRPTLSSLSQRGAVKDPAVQLLAREGTEEQDLPVSEVPQVEVKELDTVFTIRSGETIAIGGLIDNKEENADEGVPFISKLPILGNLTKGVRKVSKMREVVILVKATIIPSDAGLDPYDKDLYTKFIQDPRPITFD